MSDVTELPSESDHGGSVIALWHNLRRCAILYSVTCDKWTISSGCVEPRRGAELIMSIFDSAVRCPTVSLDSAFFQLHDKTHTNHGVGGAVPLNEPAEVLRLPVCQVDGYLYHFNFVGI